VRLIGTPAAEHEETSPKNISRSMQIGSFKTFGWVHGAILEVHQYACLRYC
jgi:hypothetical protein